ncbi:hypothetical protein DFJ74DRAFT_668067 [Hyaloraphidium curvatum]|nr:hypothetical protein DFJ74DRAFT_668067 [Hyaloraphidium curvatum]
MVATAAVAVWNTAYAINNLRIAPGISSVTAVQLEFETTVYNTTSVYALRVLALVASSLYLIVSTAFTIWLFVRLNGPALLSLWTSPSLPRPTKLAKELTALSATTTALFLLDFAALLALLVTVRVMWSQTYVALGTPPLIIMAILGAAGTGVMWALRGKVACRSHGAGMEGAAGAEAGAGVVEMLA